MDGLVFGKYWYYFLPTSELKHLHSAVSEKDRPVPYKRTGITMIKPKNKVKEVNIDFDITVCNNLISKLEIIIITHRLQIVWPKEIMIGLNIVLMFLKI